MLCRPYNFSMPKRPPVPQDQTRLFLALWPEPDLRQALLAHQRQWQWPGNCPLARPENLHLTLHFIGSVPSEQVTDITAKLAVPVAPFELALGRPALWQNGVAVLEPLATPAGLLQLREALGQALQQMGLPLEPRPFQPHLTLARHASGVSVPPSAPLLHWPVEDYALVESAAGRYRVLQHYA